MEEVIYTKKICIFFITILFVMWMYGCSSNSIAVPTVTPTPTAIPTDTPTPTTATVTPIPRPVIQIGFELNSYEKEDVPYTDVTLIIDNGKEEEKILIGSYLGDGSILDSFDSREFFNSDSIIGCQVYYAGGGDNVFAYIENSKIIVKHIEFVLGNDEWDSEIITEEVAVTREIPNNSTIKVLEQDIDNSY